MICTCTQQNEISENCKRTENKISSVSFCGPIACVMQFNSIPGLI